jgi:hypothetical protein
VAFRKELKRVIARGIENIHFFLEDLFDEKTENERNLFTEIMMHPTALSGYIGSIRKFIKEG